MGTFLLLCMIGVAAMLVIGVIGTVVGALFHLVFWVVTLPFREEARPRTINVEVAA